MSIVQPNRGTARALLVMLLLALLLTTAGLAAAQGGGDRTHEVKEGETLADIAELYLVPIADLMAVNNLTSEDELEVGQVLIIPGPEEDTAPVEEVPAEPVTATVGSASSYTVQRGDTIDTIGQAFNVAADAIVAANFGPDDNPAIIYPGDVLTIPAGPAYFDDGGQPTNAVVARPDGQGGGSTFSGNGETYVVQRNDVLDVIGQQFDVAVEAIGYANGIEPPYRIYPGDVLVIPVGSTPYGQIPPGPGEPGFIGQLSADAAESGGGGADIGQGGGGATYTVQQGDTVLSVVFGLGVDLTDFLRANPRLLNEINLSPGDELVVP